MAPPNVPVAIQAWWNDEPWTAGNPWEQTDADYLMTCLQSVDIDRWAFRGALRASTCQIVCTDPDLAIRPGKVSGPLYDNMRLGRRVRVLLQDPPGSGTWRPGFFGYIKSPEPDPLARTALRATITLDSPLAVLAPMEITLPPSDHPWVYKASDPDHSALALLLKAANLWGTDFVDLDDVGAVEIDGVWGNGTKSFGAWLGELCGFSGCILADEPQYATAAGQADFKLHWYLPTADTPVAVQWSATDGDLEMTPRIEWNGDSP